MSTINKNKLEQPVDFGTLTADDLATAAELIISKSKEKLNKITSIENTDKTFENTMIAYDELFSDLSDVASCVYLCGFVHPDDEIREKALSLIADLEKFETDLLLDETLFESVKSYIDKNNITKLDKPHFRFADDVIKSYERNGFLLEKELRDKLKVLKNRLTETGIRFDANISEYSDYLIITKDETVGLPDDYLAARIQPDGTYKIDLNYPSYRPFMQLAENGDVRKRLYFKYLNRAADKNVSVLDEMIRLRKEIAQMLGFRSFAEYKLADKMAKSAENVWSFEEDLENKVRTKALADYAELIDEKKKQIAENADTIENHEASFYSNLLLKNKYKVDNLEVKEYFEMNNVIKGLFEISEKLFDIKIVELQDKSVWHPDVRYFSVEKDDSIIARFYLDLYPRENKYSHAACFPLHGGRMRNGKYRNPLAALVCNFPIPAIDRPSLLPHDDVVTFFHEFGHLLHCLLTKAELGTMSGTNVAADFVETPSQLFENWAWHYDSLKLFAFHYKTGEVLPRDLYDRMWNARNVGSGLFTLQQIFYGTLDLTLYDKFNPEAGETVSDTVKKLQNKITLYPYLDGTCFEAGFGHLNGYAAGYYGYLWSLVYAQDIFSVFEKEGIFSGETGKRYLETVLSKGSSEDEQTMAENFLGRSLDSNPFLKSLGL